MPVISTRDVSLHKRVKREALERGVPIYEIIEKLVKLGLDLNLMDGDTLGKVEEVLEKKGSC